MSLSRKRNLKLIASVKILKELNQMEIEEQKKKIILRKCWVKPLLIKRSEHDLEANLLKDLLWEEDTKDFKNFTRLDIHQFEELLSLVYNSLKKSDTVMRTAITPRMKLCLSLRYLATGDSLKSLEFLSRISRDTIGAFLPHVLRAIYESLQQEQLKVPHREAEWLKIANDFNSIWQFPHTLGALIDGKHIRIKAPPDHHIRDLNSLILKDSTALSCSFVSMHTADSHMSMSDAMERLRTTLFFKIATYTRHYKMEL